MEWRLGWVLVRLGFAGFHHVPYVYVYFFLPINTHLFQMDWAGFLFFSLSFFLSNSAAPLPSPWNGWIGVWKVCVCDVTIDDWDGMTWGVVEREESMLGKVDWVGYVWLLLLVLLLPRYTRLSVYISTNELPSFATLSS